jgi:GTP cyclohydrolase I
MSGNQWYVQDPKLVNETAIREQARKDALDGQRVVVHMHDSEGNCSSACIVYENDRSWPWSTDEPINRTDGPEKGAHTVVVGPSTVHTWKDALSAVDDESLAGELLRRIAGLDDKQDPQHRDTPRRFVASLKELTTPEEYNFTVFQAKSQDMVVVRDIPFVSLCQHHILPFRGVAHVGYVPNELMAGLSKLARCVRYHAAALQVQERLTFEIVEDLVDKLRPSGVAVVMDAEHMCMCIRGVQVPGAMTRTARMYGCFADHAKTAKAEFMEAIR